MLTGLALPLTLSRPVKGLLVWLFFVVPSSSFGPCRGLGFRVDVFRKVDSHWRRIRDRSKNPHLVSYAGLAPRSSQSGLRPIRHGSIPAGANRWLRGTFVRAVVSHIAHAPDSWLSQSYELMKVAGRSGRYRSAPRPCCARDAPYG